MEPVSRPRLAADRPGTGGRIRAEAADFEVEELPAYAPSGEGPHLYLWVEKRGLDARALLRRLADRYGLEVGELGVAGNKDRHAVTRQWVSLPLDRLGELDPEAQCGELDDEIRVLAADRHGNKLRRGHLRGNRFRIVVRDPSVAPAEAAARARAILERLAGSGLPNFYGPQRFGAGGRTLRLGHDLLRDAPGARKAVRKDRFLKRLALNSVQSELFNRVLAVRLRAGWLGRVHAGDVLQRPAGRRAFRVDAAELAASRERLDRGELVPTGPLPGPKMLAPEGAPGRLERAVQAASGVADADLARFSRLVPGARRPLTVPIGTFEVEPLADGLRVSFELPSGSYASVLLDELMGEGAEPRDAAAPGGD